eukprot:1050296-Rhodomonas_salina.2
MRLGHVRSGTTTGLNVLVSRSASPIQRVEPGQGLDIVEVGSRYLVIDLLSLLPLSWQHHTQPISPGHLAADAIRPGYVASRANRTQIGRRVPIRPRISAIPAAASSSLLGACDPTWHPPNTPRHHPPEMHTKQRSDTH